MAGLHLTVLYYIEITENWIAFITTDMTDNTQQYSTAQTVYQVVNVIVNSSMLCHIHIGVTHQMLVLVE